ncbi:MAG: BrnT family toxin [Rhodospirillaceae bacterium]|nr:BrnT family toxin [Rhodospirillaceae bacterium]
MIDLAKIVGFEWDHGNIDKIRLKHDVATDEVEQVFQNDPIIKPDLQHSRTELRYHAFGSTREGRLLHVAFTLRREGRLIRVISARSMSRQERKAYEEYIEKEAQADSEVPH